MMTNLIALAQATQLYVAQVRHALHQIPETRFETPMTRTFIREEIAKHGSLSDVKMVMKESKGGIVVDLDVNSPFRPDLYVRTLFRADFDALPVPEKTGLPFASTHEGKSHACGHDTHVAMLLGFLKLVAEGTVVPSHNLRLVFQDAEENPGTAPEPISGGDMLVQEGVCDGISAAYALHVWNNPESGTPGVFLSRPGGMLGNSGRIKFIIKASGGHTAMPHSGVNALRAVNAVMNQLSTFAARNMKSTDPVALEPVICNSGKGSNVMPAEAELWYGFRTLLPRDEHIAMTTKVIEEARKAAASVGAEISEVMPIYGHPALINNKVEHGNVATLLGLSGQTVSELPPMLGGEDFAHYLYKVPGAMFMLGTHGPDSGGDHHSPTFNPDESVLWKGVLFWALLATN